MKLRAVLIIIAIILAAVAVFAVITYTSNIKQTAEKEVEKIEVLVAAQNIPKNTYTDNLLSSKSVVLQAIPRKYLADGVLTSLDDYKGFVTIGPISIGEQITSTKFARPEQISMTFNIPSDMVAISIPVNEVIGVSNLINVGDMINVIATFKPETSQNTSTTQQTTGAQTQEAAATTEETLTSLKEPITKTILWNVKVLYIGTRTVTAEEQKEKTSKILSTQTEKEKTPIKVSTVTLAVLPEDSEKLVFSEEMGSVWLALVPSEGVQEKETLGRTYNNIFEN
jgi:Flp pilus assembly protein CpaB